MTMWSERSEREHPTMHTLGTERERADVATEIGIDADRVAIVPSRAAGLHALFFVLGDPGDEALVANDPLAIDVAVVAGLDATPLPDLLDGDALFEAAGERTRVIVVDGLEPELVELLAELSLPIVTRDASLVRHRVFESEEAPLAIVLTERWLAVLGPEDRAGPLLTRLAWHAHVFLAHAEHR